MRQYQITSENICASSEDDAVLDPSDPVHHLKAIAAMGGLGSRAALANYNNASVPKVNSENLGRVQREENIKPGTDAWFKLWFGRKQ